MFLRFGESLEVFFVFDLKLDSFCFKLMCVYVGFLLLFFFVFVFWGGCFVLCFATSAVSLSVFDAVSVVFAHLRRSHELLLPVGIAVPYSGRASILWSVHPHHGAQCYGD